MLLDKNIIAPLPTPEEMAGWDRLVMEKYGLKSELLMENACREALAVCLELLGDVTGLRAVCFAGPGNNGGDAFGLARHLRNAGAEVLLLMAKPQSEAKGAAAYHLRLARQLGIDCRQLSRYNLDNLFEPEAFPDLVIDGLLGTGFQGGLREEYQRWIEKINSLGCAGSFILAIDTPSGLDGLTGRPQPIAVEADATVSFHAAKLGLALPEAAPYVGELHVRNIGIPPETEMEHPAAVYQVLPGIVNHLPPINRFGHKGDFGHVLIVGGSPGLTGAVSLAAMGALRAGAGLATVACPGELCAEVKSGFPECMTLPLGSGTSWDNLNIAPLLDRLNTFDSLVLGNGMGRTEAATHAIRRILEIPRPPSILDADALYHLAVDSDMLKLSGPRDVLTPHPGEMSRMLGLETAQVQADRISALRSCSEKTPAMVVLKGAGTLARQEPGPTFLCPVASPCLAVGGSGDILAGLMGSLLARGLASDISSLLAVYWHGVTGQLLDNNYPHRGNLAREIADALPRGLEQLYDQSQRHHDA